MFGFMNPIQVMKERAREREHWRQYAATKPARPWTEDFKITREPALFAGDTFTPFRLFDVACGPFATKPHEALGVLSPNKLWLYDESTMDAGYALPLITGAVRSHWLFNAPAPITRLWEFTEKDCDWRLWMSYTPFEIASQRPGLKLAKGHTIIAGLGMGWLLTRVAQKKSVKKVTLVEINPVLVDWILPRVRAQLTDAENAKITVVIADAKQAVMGMVADVALWDIWEGMGDVDARDEQQTNEMCFGIKRTWFWGAHIKRQRDEGWW